MNTETAPQKPAADHSPATRKPQKNPAADMPELPAESGDYRSDWNADEPAPEKKQ